MKNAWFRPVSLWVCWQVAWLVGASVLSATLTMPLKATAQTQERGPEISRQVKAAYLYKFTSYVEWPSGAFVDASSPLIIGVMGDDALAEELEHLVASRTVNGRPLSVRKVRRGDASLDGMHMLFVGRLEKNRLLETLATLKGRPILTVTDADEALGLGSMINFLVTGDRLRFEVALPAAETSRLKISALMLAAAYKVVKEP